MTKFNIQQWADYVRGLADPDLATEMDDFLQSGASSTSHGKARREVAVLRQVAQLAETDRRLEPPADAVRCVKALGGLRRDDSSSVVSEASSVLERIAMALSFDSLLATEVGTRDLAHGHRAYDRQLIFEADELIVDLRVESDSRQATVVGQLMCEGAQAEPLAGVPVFFLSNDRVLGQTQTGELGEFQLEKMPTEAVELRFVLGNDRCLEVPLPRPE